MARKSQKSAAEVECLQRDLYQPPPAPDVKASNILIRPDGSAVLIDFGVARLGELGLTRFGEIVGTPGSQAPEQLSGASITGATDQWALAAMIYELLTGRFPDGSTSTSEPSILSQAEGHAALGVLCDIRRFRPDIDARSAGALMRALSRDPDGRFPTVIAFVEAFGGADGITRKASSNDAPRSPRAPRLLLTCAGIGAALVSAYYLGRHTSRHAPPGSSTDAPAACRPDPGPSATGTCREDTRLHHHARPSAGTQSPRGQRTPPRPQARRSARPLLHRRSIVPGLNRRHR